MAAESKATRDLTPKEENEILYEIFQGLSIDTQDIIAALRFALYGQERSAVNLVQKYIREVLAPKIIREYTDTDADKIPASSLERFQNNVADSLQKMIFSKDFAGIQFKEFYLNIARILANNSTARAGGKKTWLLKN